MKYLDLKQLVNFKVPRQVSDSLNSGLTEEEMKSIETISSEKHMLNNSHDNMHTKIRTSAPNVNRLRTPNNALSSTARSLPSRRNTSKMSRNSLGKHKKDVSLKSCATDPRTRPNNFVIW